MDFTFLLITLFFPIQWKQICLKMTDTLEMLAFYFCLMWKYFWLEPHIQVSKPAKIILKFALINHCKYLPHLLNITKNHEKIKLSVPYFSLNRLQSTQIN